MTSPITYRLSMLRSLAAGFSVVAGSSACASLFSNAAEEPSVSYHVAPPGPAWQAVDPGPDDKVYQLPSDHSVLSVKSVCGQYGDLSLEELTRSILTGLGDRQVMKTHPTRMGTFPALRTDVEGRMDATPYVMSHTVARIHACVYDLTLVATPATYAGHQGEYSAFLDSFKEGGGK